MIHGLLKPFTDGSGANGYVLFGSVSDDSRYDSSRSDGSGSDD